MCGDLAQRSTGVERRSTSPLGRRLFRWRRRTSSRHPEVEMRCRVILQAHADHHRRPAQPANRRSRPFRRDSEAPITGVPEKRRSRRGGRAPVCAARQVGRRSRFGHAPREQRIGMSQGRQRLRFLDSGPSACDVRAIASDPQVRHLLALSTRCTAYERRSQCRRPTLVALPQAGPSQSAPGPRWGLHQYRPPRSLTSRRTRPSSSAWSVGERRAPLDPLLSAPAFGFLPHREPPAARHDADAVSQRVGTHRQAANRIEAHVVRCGQLRRSPGCTRARAGPLSTAYLPSM